MRRIAVRCGLAVLLLGATFAAFRSMPAPLRAERGERFVPDPVLARLTSLGFDALVSDYHWLQAVQLVGGSAAPAEHGGVLGRLVDVVTSLNPWVGHPYRFAALWMTDDEEDVRAANRLLERGVAYHPSDWRNRFYLGFNHFFYLEDEERAAEVLEGAVDLPGAPLYLKRLVARLKARSANLKVAQAFLEELVRTTQDPYAQAEYEKALDEIKTERRARRLERARRRYQEVFGKDITRVEDLVEGPHPVLDHLPRELHDWEWVIDEETDRIVSSYYGHRYEVQFHPADQERREAWRGRRAAAGGEQ